MEKIAVHLAEGFEEIEAVSIIDVLRRADLDVTTVSVTGYREVTGAHDIVITADKLFEEVDYEEYQMIVLPGGMPGSINLKNHEGLRKQILEYDNNSKPLAAVCAAPLVFGSLGILKDRSATCYPGVEIELTGARYTGAAVEQSDHIITGKGAGVAIGFALKIAAMFRGEDFAENLGKKMIYNPSH